MSAGLLMRAGGSAAGAFRSLPGLGGGIETVPLPAFAFDLALREAVGISLVPAAVHLQPDVANLAVEGDRRIAAISVATVRVMGLRVVLAAAAA